MGSAASVLGDSDPTGELAAKITAEYDEKKAENLED
jgi:hypothetical protein